MGQIKSKQHPKKDPISVTINNLGFITGCSNSFLKYSGYEYNDIHMKHMADMLLTGIIRRLHKSIFIPKYKKSTGKERARLRNFIKIHMKKIRGTISTPNGIKKIYISVIETNAYNLNILIKPCCDNVLTVSSAISDLIPPILRDCPIKTTPTLYADNVGIISMDLCGSTPYIDSVGIGPYIASQTILFNELRQRLDIDLFPLVRLHEVLGDSFVMTVNAPWWCVNRVQVLEEFILIVAQYLTWHMNNICTKFFNGKIFIRCGVSWGSVVANITGRHFRMYGRCFNVACRLEGLCQRNYVHMLDNSSSNKINLKGFKDMFPTTQFSAEMCPTIEEIGDIVIRTNALKGLSTHSAFYRSKNVYAVQSCISRSNSVFNITPTPSADIIL
jgi:hypothetical protein